MTTVKAAQDLHRLWAVHFKGEGWVPTISASPH
jgi:hypothetical protein